MSCILRCQYTCDFKISTIMCSTVDQNARLTQSFSNYSEMCLINIVAHC